MDTDRHRYDWQGVAVGAYIPDLLVDDRVVVDTKVAERIADPLARPDAELSSYHGAEGRPDSQLRRAKLEWERIVL